MTLDPMTPVECDLRGLPFMPLDVVRLLDSDLFALSTGEEFKAAVALWCKCWLQVPAASLPDDDRILAALAGLGRDTRAWAKVKDMAMRGFVRCSDGRWYHEVIAKKAIEAWAHRLNQRKKSAAGNAKRWKKYSNSDPTTDPRGDASSDPCGDATRDRKGQGEGELSKEIPAHAPVFPARPDFDPSLTRPTKAAAACVAMRANGLADCNPSHPELLALVDAGAGNDVFADAAQAAVSKGKGFGYVLGTVRGRMADAAKTASLELAKPVNGNGFKTARQALIEGGAAAIFDGATHV